MQIVYNTNCSINLNLMGKTNLNHPLVSVVITTKNEEKNIDNCLTSIQHQTYPKESIEIIVVDNDSADATKDIAHRYTKKVLNKGPERSAQRNFGASKSMGKYYMYLDADMILNENVVSECVEAVEKDSAIVGVYIPEIVMGDSFFSKVRRFERSFYNGTVIDCVRFVPLKIFQKVNGFDESMSGPEDWDFDKKIRQLGKTSIIKSVIYHNEAEVAISSYLKKKGYYAKSMQRYVSKWGKTDPDTQKQLGLWYRYIGVFTEKGKWIELLKNPHLAFSMFALRILVGSMYICSKFLVK